MTEAPRAFGILGGTFDPIHLGHMALAYEAFFELALDHLLFVPNADPPHKQDQEVTPARHREAMVALAIGSEPGFRLSRIELEREGPSYAVETVAELVAQARREGRPEPWFVMSAETLDEFRTWREPERILDLCRLAVAPRPGAERLEPAWAREHYPGRADRFTFLPGPELDIAATDIRARLATGASVRDLVPDAVVDYIEAHGLYRGRRGSSTVRTIGLLGGMSWESSMEYERRINTEVRAALGGVHSASLVIRSYDFAEIERLQAAGDWDAAGAVLAADARHLQAAGAELIVLCTNTMHRCADAIEGAIDVPFLHLADATARAVVEAGLERVALLGTRYTMEEDFYRERLEDHGLEVMVPHEPDRTTIHDVIYGELVQGVVSPDSRSAYLEIIEGLVERGAQGVIAGCTEIELLVGPDDVNVPYFPTTALHAQAAARWALAGPGEA